MKTGVRPAACGAVVLAAGDSTRIGFPKALLTLGGRPFLAHIREALAEAGVDQVRVVLGRDAARIRAVVTLADEEVVLNPSPEGGMLSSLVVGLGALPAGLGARLLASPTWRRRLTRFTGDRTITTTSIGGFALLRAVAGLRRWRRGTLRYREEDARIRDWLARIDALAAVDYDLAVEVAANQRLVRGYGDTHARGLSGYARLLAAAERLAGRPGAASSM